MPRAPMPAVVVSRWRPCGLRCACLARPCRPERQAGRVPARPGDQPGDARVSESRWRHGTRFEPLPTCVGRRPTRRLRIGGERPRGGRLYLARTTCSSSIEAPGRCVESSRRRARRQPWPPAPRSRPTAAPSSSTRGRWMPPPISGPTSTGRRWTRTMTSRTSAKATARR